MGDLLFSDGEITLTSPTPRTTTNKKVGFKSPSHNPFLHVRFAIKKIAKVSPVFDPLVLYPSYHRESLVELDLLDPLAHVEPVATWACPV